jgi:hypothetical protein
MPGWRMRLCFGQGMVEGIGRELSGLWGHGSGSHWQPGADGMCLHTIILDPSDAGRIFIAWGVSNGRWREELAAYQSWTEVGTYS